MSPDMAATLIVAVKVMAPPTSQPHLLALSQEKRFGASPEIVGLPSSERRPGECAMAADYII